MGAIFSNDCEHVGMDVIKKESEVDPLVIQSSDNTDTDEKKPLSEDGNLLNPYVVGIKTECKDHSCNLTSDIKVEETTVPTNFSTINCKAEEWNVSHLEVMDRTDIKTEIKVEDSPVPIGLPMVKTEIDKDVFELDRVQQERKVEVSSEEDEVFSESHGSEVQLDILKKMGIDLGLNTTPGVSFSRLLKESSKAKHLTPQVKDRRRYLRGKEKMKLDVKLTPQILHLKGIAPV
ncbi:uncharacterized protein [Periplaneta americana]|uniref:uncharacterized protein isoform X3 n=1 Tax=Periplaneta americana TaxID=6978 RepID=UPI0037E8B536